MVSGHGGWCDALLFTPFDIRSIFRFVGARSPMNVVMLYGILETTMIN